MVTVTLSPSLSLTTMLPILETLGFTFSYRLKMLGKPRNPGLSSFIFSSSISTVQELKVKSEVSQYGRNAFERTLHLKQHSLVATRYDTNKPANQQILG